VWSAAFSALNFLNIFLNLLNLLSLLGIKKGFGLFLRVLLMPVVNSDTAAAISLCFPCGGCADDAAAGVGATT
jgi:hypothetical protein